MDCSDESLQLRKRGRPRGWRKQPTDQSFQRRSSSRLGKREGARVSYEEQLEQGTDRVRHPGLTSQSWKRQRKQSAEEFQVLWEQDGVTAIGPTPGVGASQSVTSSPLEEDPPDIWRRPDAEEVKGEPEEKELSWDERIEKARGDFFKDVSLETRKRMAAYVFFLAFERHQSKMKAYAIVAETCDIGKRTAWNWVNEYLEKGYFEPSQRGAHSKSGPWIMLDAETRDQFVSEMRKRCTPKGSPNLTALDAMDYINRTLLPDLRERIRNGECTMFGLNDLPDSISESTAARWLVRLDFTWRRDKKGLYVDGHERADVVKYRQETFLPLMEALQQRTFVVDPKHPENEPMLAPELERITGAPAFASADPYDVVSSNVIHIILWHDECVFNANDDQRGFWSQSDQAPIKSKSQGKGLMISDFCSVFGWLGRTDEEYAKLCSENPGTSVPQSARVYWEFGKDHYWNSDCFMDQLVVAMDVGESIWPAPGYRLVFVIDNASGHVKWGDDALLASEMNVYPGGKQPMMHDTVWEDESGVEHVQQMYFLDEDDKKVPKGLKLVLQERGLFENWMKQPDMVKKLSEQPDFANEKCQAQRRVEARGHIWVRCPKYHCELMPIEKGWMRAKIHTRAFCGYKINALRKRVPEGLALCTPAYFRSAICEMLDYCQAYRDGDNAMEAFKKVKKSHRKPRKRKIKIRSIDEL